jgi:restriction system protein
MLAERAHNSTLMNTSTQKSTDPLHGLTLEAILTALVAHFGWTNLGQRIPIRCFTDDPSINSSLKFLRKTPWAREKVARDSTRRANIGQSYERRITHTRVRADVSVCREKLISPSSNALTMAATISVVTNSCVVQKRYWFVAIAISDKSLFARLLRAPWWVSFLVAAVVGASAFALFPKDLKAAGALSSGPFIVIGLIAAWKQRNTLSPSQIEATLEKLAAMSAREFADTLATAYERDGYAVTHVAKPGVDLSLEKNGYTTLVSCKRWKAANQGIEPLRELLTAMEKADTGRGIYVALNSVSDAAAQFAAKNGIRVLFGGELAALTR